jgi:hypothetical protein
MLDGLSRLECNICGQSIYFAVPEENESFLANQDAVIEVTCPRGHSDRFTHAELEMMNSSGKVEPRYLAVAAGF